MVVIGVLIAGVLAYAFLGHRTDLPKDSSPVMGVFTVTQDQLIGDSPTANSDSPVESCDLDNSFAIYKRME